MQDVRAVLFDLDGTLLDSAPDLALTGNALRQQRSLAPLDLATYRPYAGSGARGILQVALGVTPAHASYGALREEFLNLHEQHLLAEATCFPGVEETLYALVRNGVAWGVVTNKASRFTLPTMKAFNVFRSAAAVVSGDTTLHTKPHPAPVLAALEAAGLDSRSTLYVGDDERDIQAGRAAGVRTVAAAYGYLGPHADPQHWKADAVIHAAIELLKLLKTA